MRDERPADDVDGRGALWAGGADACVAEVDAFIVMVDAKQLVVWAW